MRKIWTAVSWASIATSAVAFTASPWADALHLAYRYADPFALTQYRLSRLDPKDYELHARAALEDGDVEDARAIVELAETYGKPLPQDLTEQISYLEANWMLANSTAFAEGFVMGSVDNGYAMAGSIVSDIMVVGDIRDAATQGYSLVTGADYSPVILSLALFGIATTAAYVVPGGQAADFGASAFKTTAKAARAGNVPKSGLLREVETVARNAVDMDAARSLFSLSSLATMWRSVPIPSPRDIMARFRSSSPLDMDATDIRRSVDVVDTASLDRLSTSAAGVFRPGSLAKLSDLMGDVATVGRTADMKSAVRVINLADNADDARTFAKLSAHTGKRTSSTLRMLGKNAIRFGDLIATIVMAIVSVFAWLLWVSWMSFKGVRVIVRSAARVARA